jgi:hypothetical protein
VRGVDGEGAKSKIMTTTPAKRQLCQPPRRYRNRPELGNITGAERWDFSVKAEDGGAETPPARFPQAGSRAMTA